MTASQNQDNTLDSTVRKIVREELRIMFMTVGDSAYEEPRMLNLGEQSSSDHFPTAQRRGKGKRIKGRVTNPSTDKRLKANRDADA